MDHQGILSLLNLLQHYNEFDLRTTISSYDDRMWIEMSYGSLKITQVIDVKNIKLSKYPIEVIGLKMSEMRTFLSEKYREDET